MILHQLILLENSCEHALWHIHTQASPTESEDWAVGERMDGGDRVFEHVQHNSLHIE